MKVASGVLFLVVISGELLAILGVPAREEVLIGMRQDINGRSIFIVEYHPPPPPPIPRCNFGHLMDIAKEVLKGCVSKSVDDYIGNRTDIIALNIKNVLCVTDMDKIKLVTSVGNFISSCMGMPDLSSADKEMLEKVEELISGGQKACVVWNAMRYETVDNTVQFNRAEVVFENLCESLCLL